LKPLFSRAVLGQMIQEQRPIESVAAQLDRFVTGERSLTLASATKISTALGLVLVPRR
jgi:hypothetical protein